jgi:hypothetical protein
MTTSAQIRSQPIQALTLGLVGPTPGVLAQLALQGRTEKAAVLREEVLDRPPNRWYQSDFLIPSETSLDDRADDGADDEFVFQGQLQAYGASGARRGRSPTIVQVGENGASKVEPMGLG